MDNFEARLNLARQVRKLAEENINNDAILARAEQIALAAMMAFSDENGVSELEFNLKEYILELRELSNNRQTTWMSENKKYLDEMLNEQKQN